MINLLPPDALTLLQTDYRRQRRTVAAAAGLGLLAAGGLILGVLFYKLSDDLTTARAAFAARETSADTAALKTLTQIATESQAELTKLARLKTEAPTPSTLIEVLTAHRLPGLVLTDLLYDATGKETRVGLQGVAATRAIYLEWLKALRSDPLVAEVNAPLADIIRDQNIRFSIAILLKHGS